MKTSAIATLTVIGIVLGLALLLLVGVMVIPGLVHHKPSCDELRQQMRAATKRDSTSTTPVTREEYEHNKALSQEFMKACFPNAH